MYLFCAIFKQATCDIIQYVTLNSCFQTFQLWSQITVAETCDPGYYWFINMVIKTI